ncbi:MAG: hypothetical protein ACI9VR_005093 [Cognaticolwellia sp.]|jgi:hypothetical protein
MFLLLLACGYPDGPPAPPSNPNTMDTASFAAPSQGAVKVRVAPVREVEGSASLSTPITKKGPVALQVDGTLVSIVWLVNGTVISRATGRSLDPIWFKSSDRIQAKVELSDGSTRRTVETAVVKVDNSPPEFTVDQRDFTQIDGFVVAAEDADGDALTWSITGGPLGMEINPRTGQLSYQASQGAKGGNYKARIVVKDPSGYKDVWPLTLDVSGGQEDQVKRRYGGD